MTEYDPIEQHYIIIEDVINLRDSILKYEAIKPDGTPDLSWTLNVHDQAGFGIRRYTFEGDSAELAAMWKCCLSRQIDLNRSKTGDGDSSKQTNQELESVSYSCFYSCSCSCSFITVNIRVIISRNHKTILAIL